MADLATIIREAFQVGMTQVPEEIHGLAEFVQAIRPHNVLEIGSDRGGTFYLWCKLATGKKVSIDLPCGPFYSSEVTEGRSAEIAQEMKTWADDVHTIRGDSHSMGVVQRAYEILGGEKLDFLFIDGDHSYEGVSKDYRLYKPLVRPGGWVGFHDTNHTQHHVNLGCYVGQFWNELQGEKITISQANHWAGIGLLKV